MNEEQKAQVRTELNHVFGLFEEKSRHTLLTTNEFAMTIMVLRLDGNKIKPHIFAMNDPHWIKMGLPEEVFLPSIVQFIHENNDVVGYMMASVADMIKVALKGDDEAKMLQEKITSGELKVDDLPHHSCLMIQGATRDGVFFKETMNPINMVGGKLALEDSNTLTEVGGERSPSGVFNRSLFEMAL